MNKFYQTKVFLQFSISILMIVILLFCISSWISLENNLVKLIMVFVIIPIHGFLATPLYTKFKIFNYLSPMLFYMKKGEDILELHSGTSFDYIFVMGNTKASTKWKNTMLGYYLDGLGVIIEKAKNGNISLSTQIIASSYFLSNSLTKKLGFKITKPNVMAKINFIIGYIDLVWMHSLANGKLSFPKFKNLNKITISVDDLVKSEFKINQYQEYFRNRIE